ncbi:hypothetical protein OH492_04995 [Vibrio chagasii]|nr:hypothetical protein [Vibrio chagasii]
MSLYLVIKEWLLVLKPGGTLSILIPTDLVLHGSWSLYDDKKTWSEKGWNYDYIMAREHVNPCNNLIAFFKVLSPDNKQHTLLAIKPNPAH